MSALLVFLGMALTDFLWGRYIMATSSDRAISAGVYSSAIVGLGSLVTLAYVGNPWLVIPAMLGAGVGTIAAVRRG